MITARIRELLLVTLGGLALVLSLAVPAALAYEDYNDEIDAAEEERDAIQDQLADLEAALESTDADIAAATLELAELEAEYEILQRRLDEANQRVADARLQQELLAARLSAAQDELASVQEQIEADAAALEAAQLAATALAVNAMKGASSNVALDVLSGSTDRDDLFTRYSTERSETQVQSAAIASLEEAQAVTANLEARQTAVEEYVAELKAEADALLAEEQAARDEVERLTAEAEVSIAQQQALKDELESKRAQYLQQQAAKEAEEEAIKDEIADLIQKQKEAEQARQGPAISNGWFGWPVDNVHITSNYGTRWHPVYQYWSLHTGTDFAAACGQPLYATQSGTVYWAMYRPYKGNQVLLDHGFRGGISYMTAYGHMSAFAVSSGQYVEKGQLIGYAGTTGTSTGCHLHYEIWEDGVQVDPMGYY